MRNSSFRNAAPAAIGAFLLLAGSPGTAASQPAAGPSLASAAAAAAPAADIGPTPAPDPASLLLLLVDLDGITLTEGLAAYGSPDDPLIPVGEFSRLLELDIDVLPSERRIVGRLGEARRSLVVDLATSTARVGPAEIRLTADDIAVTPTEIYLRASALQKLLPIKLDIDPRQLTMKVITYELLPLQSRLQRQARQRLGSPSPGAATEALRVAEPYRLFSPPSFDVALALGAQTAAPRAPARYDIRLGGDLAYMGLQAYVGSDEEGRATTTRILLERRSIDGTLLGPLHATVFALGDVFTPGLAIGPRSLAGRGIVVSNVPLDQTSVFNRVDLRGELPLGNDVELYVNEVLKGSQSAPDQGRYEFLNVPLVQGVNIVRIVTYGPRGQRTEETRIINVSGGLLRPGQATFEFGAVEQDEPLFQPRRRDPFASDRGVGKPRVVASVNYGVTQYLTLSGGAALYHTRQGLERNLYTAGLRTSVRGFATELDVARDNNGGQAVSLAVAGRIFGASAVLRHAEYSGGLMDEVVPEADLDRPLDRRTELTVDQNIGIAGHIVPISLRALRDVYSDGGDTLIGSARGSSALGAILFSGGLEYERTRLINGSRDERLRGYFAGSTFRNYQWQVRANIDYDILPTYRARLLTVTADRALSEIWTLRLAASEHLDTPKGFEFVAGSITRTRFGDLALTGEYATADDSWRLGMQLNFGLGYNPVTHGYELTRSGPGSGGSVLFHAFIDEDGDGRFGPGDRPVPNVALEGGERLMRTDADGRAHITGFGAGGAARLQVGLADIENPAVKAPPTTIEFSPRPGGVTEIEYPMRPTGEVMVNIKLRRPDAQLVGLSAARVRLIDAKGVAVEGVTEFDGSVSFQDLPAGTYRLELDPEQAKRLRMRLTAPVTITMKPDGGFTPDVTAEVLFEPRAETPAGVS
ncbi:MAG: hypothetical protein JWQ29_1600 [Phenylobacterium sp.]|nr:hypothetical protein [Phenylobacterium sp.]